MPAWDLQLFFFLAIAIPVSLVALGTLYGIQHQYTGIDPLNMIETSENND